MYSFKQRCLELRGQDRSLLEIAEMTGRPKTSVYYHIKNIPLSAKRLSQTRERNLAHLQNLSSKRKGVSSRRFIAFKLWTPAIVSLVAHLLFDGEIKGAGCSYNNRNTALLQIVEKHMREIYSFPPSRYLNSLTGVSRISYFNVALAGHIKVKSQQLLLEIVSMPKNLKREFVRAFFDDEGCMDFRPSRSVRQVRGYQKDLKVLELISELLLEFGILSQIQKPNEIVVSGQKNLEIFQKEIGFSRGVYINGNRTNSIWKKHIEKQKLLQRALDSFS